MEQDLLYVLLVAEGHIVTLLRPKKHSIHPSGMYPAGFTQYMTR